MSADADYHYRLGNVKSENVPHILDQLLEFRLKHETFSAEQTTPLCLPFWRGRMGTDKEEQLKLASLLEEVHDEPLTPHASRT